MKTIGAVATAFALTLGATAGTATAAEPTFDNLSANLSSAFSGSSETLPLEPNLPVVPGGTGEAIDYTQPLPGNAAKDAQYGFPTGVALGPENDFYAALMKTLVYTGQYPKGMNDFSCTSEKNPVILLPGTTTNIYNDFSKMAPALMDAGYCVYGFNHNPGTIPATQFAGDIKDSARALGLVVDRVLKETGAEKVTLVGHSQGGGIMPIYYINNYGGDKKVDHLIGLAPSNNGTTVGGMFKASEFTNGVVDFFAGVASRQQLIGSDLVNEVYHNGPVTRPGVKYTMIASATDQTVTPYTNSFIDEPGVTNITVQDHHPGFVSDHNNMTYYEQVIDLTLHALKA